ncbi:MAG: glutathione S-transferase N-terminal domain-containing protein [Proteobacteria bacterium]|nr:glutathione S-transferase N-terminal domain-containing protein [Pseudomonadota bacterium]
MLDLHYWPTPNGKKVTIQLEECGLEYNLVECNIGRGDQFKEEFLAINPNNRMPVLVDHEPDGGGDPISVFESGAIMLYIAEKTGKFMPTKRWGHAGRGLFLCQSSLDLLVGNRRQNKRTQRCDDHNNMPGHGKPPHEMTAIALQN